MAVSFIALVTVKGEAVSREGDAFSLFPPARVPRRFPAEWSSVKGEDVPRRNLQILEDLISLRMDALRVNRQTTFRKTRAAMKHTYGDRTRGYRRTSFGACEDEKEKG